MAGTVDGFDSNMVQVTLDDSDKRAVSIDNVRLLPPNYPLVGKTIKYTPNGSLYLSTVSHTSTNATRDVTNIHED